MAGEWRTLLVRRRGRSLAGACGVVAGLFGPGGVMAAEPPASASVPPPSLPSAPAEFAPDRTRTLRDLSGGDLRSEHEEARPQKIYFPPHPPPLGVEMAFVHPDRRAGAPADLAPHVLQPFYAPLSTRFASRSMTRRHEQFLVAHRDTKAALLEELRTRLHALASADRATRRRELAAFAREQTPRLAEWERAADEFRRDLHGGGLTSSGIGGWYALREWKLGRGSLRKPREETLFLEYQLLRAAVFYQEGLTPAQRRILREAAIELEEQVFRRDDVDPAAAAWFEFFAPDLARVHFPAELPSGAAERLEEFRREKAALRQELRDAVYEADSVVFAGARERALEALAPRQAARIAALETLAEEIRTLLVGHAELVPPAAPPDPPPELTVRIVEFEREKRALQRELSDRVRAVTRTLPPPYGDMVGAEELREWDRKRAAAVERETARFEAENAERLAALDARLEAIRAGVEELAGPAAAFGLGGGFDSFLSDFLTSRRHQLAQREYHLAVFEPGLSPEQRRLLFDAAVTALDLPLPGPEEQPTSLPGTILK